MLILVVIYLILLLVLGILAERIGKRDSEGYFLAGRGFKPVVLFFTMTATNFSAFFFLGFSGHAYRYGFAEYGIMVLGTAFMPVMFYLLGRKAWKLGREKGYTTAPELLGGEMDSRALQLLVMAIMVIFTLPYLAIQAVGAGLIISALSGIDALTGAIVVSIVIGAYVSLGGMRASGWTDVVQGVIMFSAMLMAGIFIASSLGGMEAAGEMAYRNSPELFGREAFPVSIWFSFIVLWIFADPMFPQLFSRFYTAKDEKALKTTMVLYPFLISFLFLIPVLIGIWGRGAGLELENPDQVMIAMVGAYAPEWVFYLVMLGALSALMSTADSQLFSISTMAVRDTGLGRRFGEVRTSMAVTWMIVIGAIFYAIHFFRTDSEIMDFLVKNSFSGLAVLAPVFIAGLYWKRTGRISSIVSIILGEVYVVLSWIGMAPDTGFLDGVVAISIAAVSLIFLSYMENYLLGRYRTAREIS